MKGWGERVVICEQPLGRLNALPVAVLCSSELQVIRRPSGWTDNLVNAAGSSSAAPMLTNVLKLGLLSRNILFDEAPPRGTY